ncbi:progesterone-induced-blocking factor 1 [Patella vulgata]|uniref:progesterone-induced-blocking factor 1 n=1 Tax=Patella vulgata TaxID=6465 RepID=UPI00217F6392|nr:progesterone-induced-blocking factor 1 [Patella vulgata]
MAARDLSKTFEEFESEDFSLETSVPTDFTMSPEPSESKQNKRQITKHLIERKQLIHDLQLLRIELSQKNLAIENMKAESIQRVDELEEKLNDTLHQKQILQARLESQLAIQEEDAKKRQDMIKHELLDVRQRQQQLESANNRLREKAGDVMRSLKDLNLSEEKFYELRAMKEDELSLRDYVAVQLFEQTKPLQTEIDQLRMRNKTLDDGEKSSSKQTIDLQEQLAEERQQHGELRVKFQKMSLELAEIKSLVKTDNYKVENYDRVKMQRDNFESDQLDVTRQLNVLEAAHQNLLRERDELQRELSTTRQSLALIKQDKDYLSRQICDVSNKSSYTEEKLEQLNRQLEDAKRAREEMYDKYVTSRDEYKREYENKLQEELDNIRIKTNAEIDRLRTSTKEMYERENRNLREARDMAISEKEKMQATERETTTKYEQLLNEFRQLQMAGDSRVVEIQNDLKIKTFEYERAQMVYEEAMKNLKETQIDMEKMQKKNEVLF